MAVQAVMGSRGRCGPESLKKVTSYRFDDPEGKVGAEIHIVAAGDRVFQVPLTYRGVELAGADKHLISTMEHSILGTRWVYDGMGDPHFRQRLDHAIATAGTSAKQYRVDDEGNRIDEITDVAHAWGTGPLAGAEDVQVLYELNLDSPAGDPTRDCSWAAGRVRKLRSCSP